ncbi:MAG: GNAT family N-acetyltransferase [Dehalococcoidales bacterium]|nr:GNAT family N-acetyltransferase [Dehalococcoidales bacterium]
MSGAVDLRMVKVRPMTGRDVTPTLNIWWADIPEKEKLASQLGGRDDLSLIAEHGGHLVGFVLARLMYTGVPLTMVCVIFYIAVRPEYRGKGIGSLLVETLKQNCKATGIHTLRALIPREDTRIIQYFTKAGFQPSQIINLDYPV